MKIAVIADEGYKAELGISQASAGANIRYISDPEEASGAEVCFDILFDNSKDRVKTLQDTKAGLIIVNSVSSRNVPPSFIRMNGWPTFLQRPVAEVAKNDLHAAEKIEWIFGNFKRQVEWVAPIPGMITPRVVSMIINEAYFTLGENVSSREDIDLAMKLGTNYPYGPFEWAEKIGLSRICSLLEEIAVDQPRYVPSPLLKEYAARS